MSYWTKLAAWVPKDPTPILYLRHYLNSTLFKDHDTIQAHTQILSDVIVDILQSSAHRFKKFLFGYLCYSRNDDAVMIGAANAITILNANREILSGMDLSRVKVPHAILRGVILDYTNLQHADLSYANLEGAWLVGADLRSANLQNVYFGEERCLVLPNSVQALCYSTSRHFLILATGKEIRIYTLSYDLKQVPDRSRYGDHDFMFRSR